MSSALKDRLRRAVLRLCRWASGIRSADPDDALGVAARPLRLLFLQYEVALGSAVNMTPVFAAVRESMPAAHVTVAAAGAALAVLRDNPFIDEIVETPDPNRSLWRAVAAMRRIAVANGPFDFAVTNGGGMKARVALLAMVSGARLRVGYTAAPELYHRPLALDPSISVLENSARVLSVFSVTIRNPAPHLFYRPADGEAASALLTRNGVSGERPIIAMITQTSGGQPSHWYDDRFAELADRLVARYEASIVFLGAGHEVPAIETIRSRMRAPSVNLAGQTGLGLLTAVLCQCDLAVTLDTGTMHVGRAVGLPMAIIAAAWQPAHEWLPLGVRSCRILRRDIYRCPGCEKFVCPSRACMDEITVRHVEAAVESLMRDYPPSPSARRERSERCVVGRQSPAPRRGRAA